VPMGINQRLLQWVAIVALTGTLATCACAPAMARPHHARHHHYAHSYVQKQEAPSFLTRLFAGGAIGGSGSTARPRDCYGIAWCGCWLRHQLGIADTKFNLARNWLQYGSPSGPHAGAIAVWSHHVGKVLGDCPGGLIIQSGNDGHGNQAGTVCRPTRGIIGYRS
jgi:hypothetical protein